MDLSYTPEEEVFRARVRAWLAAHLPPPEERGDAERMRRWHRDLHAAGFIGCSWPTEFGGGGLTTMQQAILGEELARADASPGMGGMGVLWVGPAIIRFGTEAQKRRFIPPVLAGDEHWCTGYSEPNAGSDLAALRTRAVRDGDAYMVTGQKVWTTVAPLADWCFLLARTSTDGPKHAGLSVLLVDMQSPGITARPLRQLTGDAEFNEVFFQDVRVPVAHRLQLHGRLDPGLASALKLFCSELNQRLTEAGHAVLGAAGALLPGGAESPDRTSWSYRMLYDRCLTIAGGTSEVQRGVIAQRVLGLPR